MMVRDSLFITQLLELFSQAIKQATSRFLVCQHFALFSAVFSGKCHLTQL